MPILNDGHILAEREQVGNIKRPLTHCFLSSRSTIHSKVELRLIKYRGGDGGEAGAH
jgi:hypothetical protein